MDGFEGAGGSVLGEDAGGGCGGGGGVAALLVFLFLSRAGRGLVLGVVYGKNAWDCKVGTSFACVFPMSDEVGRWSRAVSGARVGALCKQARTNAEHALE